MAGHGGARPNSGPKKGQHRIAAGELRKALEAKLGMSYVEMLAESQLKLFNDFKMDVNVKEYIRFTENMSARLLESPTTEVNITDMSELSRSEIQDRITNLLARKALSESQPASSVVPTTDTTADQPDSGEIQ